MGNYKINSDPDDCLPSEKKIRADLLAVREPREARHDGLIGARHRDQRGRGWFLWEIGIKLEIIALEIGIGNWHWKLEIEIGNWKLAFELEIGI